MWRNYDPLPFFPISSGIFGFTRLWNLVCLGGGGMTGRGERGRADYAQASSLAEARAGEAQSIHPVIEAEQQGAAWEIGGTLFVSVFHSAC